MIPAVRSWCLGTRLVVLASALWLLFLAGHVLLTGRWWAWLLVESLPPVILVLVPLALLAVAPLARPVRWVLMPLLGAMVLAGAAQVGVDFRGGGSAALGRPVTIVSWSTDIWNAGEDPDLFFRYLRSKDADVYLLQEYLSWADGPVRIDELTSLASIHHHIGDYREAIDGHRMALERARQASERFREVDAMVRLAGSCHRARQTQLAADTARQALGIARTSRYRVLVGNALTVLAASDLARGDAGTAAELAVQAVRVHTRTGHRLGQAQSRLLAAHALQRTGRDHEARPHLAAAHSLFDQAGVDARAYADAFLGTD